jgi:hypothetical protein
MNCTNSVFLNLQQKKTANKKQSIHPSTWEADAGESHVQGQLGLHSKFKFSLGYIGRPCLQNKYINETYFFYLFTFLAVLEFELRASHLLKQALYQPSFCIGYF